MSTAGFLKGRSGRNILKTPSPFVTLLIDLSSALSDEEVSKFKLSLLVDEFVTKRKHSELKNASEVLSHLYQNEFISITDTKFLEQLLVMFGRRDLVNKIIRYHENRCKEENDQTAVKDHYERETRSGHVSPTGLTALKELKTCPHTEIRSFGDGSSSVGSKHTGNVGEQDHLESSPMVDDENSQEDLKLSEMSISDEEKDDENNQEDLKVSEMSISDEEKDDENNQEDLKVSEMSISDEEKDDENNQEDLRVSQMSISDEEKEKIGSISDETKEKIGSISDEAKEKIGSISDEAKEKIGSISVETKEKIGSISDEAKEKIGSISDEAKEKIGSISDETKEKIGSISDEAKEKIGSISDEAKEKIGQKIALFDDDVVLCSQ